MFHRTEAVYRASGVGFFGVDPLQQIVRAGNYSQQTVISNFSLNSLSDPKLADKVFSFVGVFGSVFNGIISQQREAEFWEGIGVLAHEHKSTIAFDTLVAPYFRGDSAAEFRDSPQGDFYHLGVQQYYPTRPEIQNALNTHNLVIIEELQDKVMHFTRKIIVVKAA